MVARSKPTELTISSASGSYVVKIGDGLTAEALAASPDVVIADRYFAGMLADVPHERLVLVDASEKDKTLATVERLIVAMRAAGLRRDGRVLAIGGGVVQDVATLAVQLYMRGVSWALVPTTLMSMADSCVGGKSSINVGSTKNLIGGYYPPNPIYIDPRFVETLSSLDRACGYLEAVKIAFCRGGATFDEYIARSTDDGTAATALMLANVLDAKRWFIEIDEFDRAERRILNFGHTFGHALEAGSHFGIKHGIGVGIGMLAALRFVAEERQLTVREIALETYITRTIDNVVDRSAAQSELDWDAFDRAFDSDKKHRADAYVLIVSGGGGLGAELRLLPRSLASLDRVRGALSAAMRGDTR